MRGTAVIAGSNLSLSASSVSSAPRPLAHNETSCRQASTQHRLQVSLRQRRLRQSAHCCRVLGASGLQCGLAAEP